MFKKFVENLKDILSLENLKYRIINCIETYFIVKTMDGILESIFFDSLMIYKFSIENKNNEFVILVTTEEELANGKIIKNKAIKLKSFAFLILNAEMIKSDIIKNLKER